MLNVLLGKPPPELLPSQLCQYLFHSHPQQASQRLQERTWEGVVELAHIVRPLSDRIYTDKHRCTIVA